MGSNKEIKKMMETCHIVLIVLVWISAVSGLIGGINMYSSGDILRVFGIVTLVGSIIGGIIGYFLVNVALAIPFILLNNGDILEKILKGDSSSDSNELSIVESIKEEIIGNDESNTGKVKLIIERGYNVVYSALPFEVYIDKKKAFSIEDGSRVTNFVEKGSHAIYATVDYNTESEIINFNADNSEVKFKLIVLGVGKIKLEKTV